MTLGHRVSPGSPATPPSQTPLALPTLPRGLPGVSLAVRWGCGFGGAKPQRCRLRHVTSRARVPAQLVAAGADLGHRAEVAPSRCLGRASLPPPALASAEGHGPQVGAATPTPLPAQTAFQGSFLSRRRVPCRCPRGGGACGARVRWGEGPGSAGAALGSPRLGVARPRQSPRGPRHHEALSILHVRCPAPRGLPPWKCPPRAGTRLAPLRSPQWQGARHRGEELTSPRHGPGADPEHSHQPAGHSEDRVICRLGRGLRCRLNPLFTWCGCHCPPRA